MSHPIPGVLPVRYRSAICGSAADPTVRLRHPPCGGGTLSEARATVPGMHHATADPVGVQVAFDELEPDLSQVTFVVVDLETTGTRPGTDEITEVGAIRVCGGEVQAELSTFVAIDGTLPAHVSRLTGIAPEDLHGAPSLGEVMSTFLEFSRGAVLVAHNARFDLGFLRAAAAAVDLAWPDPASLCTLALARRILHSGETRSHRLADLAAHLGATVQPTHRALADARATVDVLHALIARVGDCGVATVSELRAYDARLSPGVRRRAALTDGLHRGPGVYVFRDAAGGPLYVGSSTDVRRRARSYYSGGDTRGRMRTMVGLATAVDAVPCAHMLEAWTVEEQLIDALQPPYNRRSRSPRRGWWLEPAADGSARPRVTRAPGGPGAVGPFRRADDAREAWSDLMALPDPPRSRERWDALAGGTDSSALRALVSEVDALASRGAFERAARLRDRVAALVRLLARHQALAATAALPELVLAQAGPRRSWAVAVIRHGRLAASGSVPAGAAPMPVIDALRAGAATVVPGDGPLAGATTAQVSAVHRWIDSAPTRIVAVDGAWTMGRDGAHALEGWAGCAEQAAADAAASRPGEARTREGPRRAR